MANQTSLFRRSVYGNADVVEHLISRMPKAILFRGARGIGKGKWAREIAKQKIGTSALRHPDIWELFPEGKVAMHSQASVIQMVKEASLPPYTADRRFFIIHDVERMLPYAAHALLKVVEEPPPTTYFIFTSSEPHLLLHTFLSRVISLFFKPLSRDHIVSILKEHKQESSSEVEILSRGSAARALFLASCGGLELYHALRLERGGTLFDNKKKIERIEAFFAASLTRYMQIKEEAMFLKEEELPVKMGEKEILSFIGEVLWKQIKEVGRTPLMEFYRSLERNTPFTTALETFYLRLHVV